MPYEIMKSYLWIDLNCKNTSINSFEKFLNNSNLNSDSLKTVLKYYYQFWDYNPIMAFSTWWSKFYYSNPANSDAIIPLCSLDRLLRNRLKELNGPPFDLLSLVTAGVIAQVKIDSTVIRYINEENRKQLIVFCTIIDTIKGKIIPTLKDVSILSDPKNYHDPIPGIQSAKPGSKFQFAYNLDELRPCPDPRPIVDSLGNPWTKIGKEYIVFLFPLGVCADSINNYYFLTPLGYGSCVYHMFPINDGIIYNPLNEFGVSDGSSIDVFKEKLRELIDNILNRNTLTYSYIKNSSTTNIEFNVFPNPSENEITINYPSNYLSSQIKIYSIEGIEVLESEYKDKIDVSGFATGVYYIKVADKVLRFIKI